MNNVQDTRSHYRTEIIESDSVFFIIGKSFKAVSKRKDYIIRSLSSFFAGLMALIPLMLATSGTYKEYFEEMGSYSGASVSTRLDLNASFPLFILIVFSLVAFELTFMNLISNGLRVLDGRDFYDKDSFAGKKRFFLSFPNVKEVLTAILFMFVIPLIAIFLSEQIGGSILSFIVKVAVWIYAFLGSFVVFFMIDEKNDFFKKEKMGQGVNSWGYFLEAYKFSAKSILNFRTILLILAMGIIFYIAAAVSLLFLLIPMIVLYPVYNLSYFQIYRGRRDQLINGLGKNN